MAVREAQDHAWNVQSVCIDSADNENNNKKSACEIRMTFETIASISTLLARCLSSRPSLHDFRLESPSRLFTAFNSKFISRILNAIYSPENRSNAILIENWNTRKRHDMSNDQYDLSYCGFVVECWMHASDEFYGIWRCAMHRVIQTSRRTRCDETATTNQLAVSNVKRSSSTTLGIFLNIWENRKWMYRQHTHTRVHTTVWVGARTFTGRWSIAIVAETHFSFIPASPTYTLQLHALNSANALNERTTLNLLQRYESSRLLV